MTIQELLKAMETANSAIEELEGKRDAATEDAEKAVYQKEIDAKTADYDKAEGQIEGLKAKTARTAKIEATKKSHHIPVPGSH